MPIFLRPSAGRRIAFRNKTQAERRRMRRNIDQARHFKRFHARIPYISIFIKSGVVDIISKACRPAVIFTLLNDIYLIGRKVVPKQIPAHFRRPNVPSYRMQSHKNRIAETRGKYLKVRAVKIADHYFPAVNIFLNTNIAGGAN